MKITQVNVRIMHVPGPGGHSPRRNWIFVFIKTDVGITGVGEATTEYHEQAVASMIEAHLQPMLIGQDPTRIEFLWQQMQRLILSCFTCRSLISLQNLTLRRPN